MILSMSEHLMQQLQSSPTLVATRAPVSVTEPPKAFEPVLPKIADPDSVLILGAHRASFGLFLGIW
jgi:hypothetical protein